MRKIEISESAFKKLQDISTPLLDTPDSTISRLLDFYENRNTVEGATNKALDERIKQDDFLIFIISCLKNHNCKLSKAEVEKEIYQSISLLLSNDWYTDLVSNNVPRWKHLIAWAKEKGKMYGLIKSPDESGRGLWELTAKANLIKTSVDLSFQYKTFEALKELISNFKKELSAIRADIKKDSDNISQQTPRIKGHEIASIYFERANENAENCEYEEAINNYSAGIHFDPYFIEAYEERALLYEDLNDIKSAIEDYRKIIEISHPKDSNFFTNLGLLYSDIGDDNSAIIYYSKSIEIEPENPELYYYRACAWQRKQNFDSALQDLQQAANLRPEEISYLDFLSEIQNKIKLEPNMNNDTIMS